MKESGTLLSCLTSLQLQFPKTASAQPQPQARAHQKPEHRHWSKNPHQLDPLPTNAVTSK